MESSPAVRKTWACARCRRHKLKCDTKKPCTLCLRAEVTCEPQTTAERSRLNRQRMSRERLARRATASQQSGENHNTPIVSSSQGTWNQRNVFVHDDGLSLSGTTPSSCASIGQNVANTSSMDFARIIIGGDNLTDVDSEPAVSEEASYNNLPLGSFALITMRQFPTAVIQAAIDAYFDRFDWFVMLLHRPSFASRATSILSKNTWAQQDLCDVVLTLIVATLGLECAKDDISWPGREILSSYSLNAESVAQSLLREVGVHFYEVLSISQIQAYQILMLLTIYHTYFGSFHLAWHISGIPARAAYGLGLHNEKMGEMDKIVRQVGIRCWNHAVVGELFASMIYGRQSALDPELSQFREVEQLADEPSLPKQTASLPIFAADQQLSILTFHTLKFRLYAVVKEILQTFKSLHLGSTVSVQDLRTLVRAVNHADSSLRSYRDSLPAVFDPSQWGSQEPWEALQVDDLSCDVEDLDVRKKLGLQGIVLQVFHDSAIIFAHRPLLECRISSSGADHSVQRDGFPDSLKISVEAALRISRTDLTQFNHQLALSFLFMQQFAAGVILCVPPFCLPYSQMANESKAGVLRIISGSRALKTTNNIARHTDHLLTKLYQKTMQREMDIALQSQHHPEIGPPDKNKRDKADISASVLTNSTRFENCLSLGVQPSAHAELDYSLTQSIDDDLIRGIQEPSVASYDNQGFNSTDESIMSYLQFGYFHQDGTIDVSLNQHLDEAFSAFQQMYNLNIYDTTGDGYSSAGFFFIKKGDCDGRKASIKTANT